MNSYEDSWERLDAEFDHVLLDMKPYVLKHPNKPGERVLRFYDLMQYQLNVKVFKFQKCLKVMSLISKEGDYSFIFCCCKTTYEME